jgi:hypothetical protein
LIALALRADCDSPLCQHGRSGSRENIRSGSRETSELLDEKAAIFGKPHDFRYVANLEKSHDFHDGVGNLRKSRDFRSGSIVDKPRLLACAARGI